MFFEVLQNKILYSDKYVNLRACFADGGRQLSIWVGL